MKTLQEMNLMDDFLATSLISHKKYGEPAARYILECILRRPVGKLTVVSQQVMYGLNPKAKGIRMDVYLDEDGGEIAGRKIGQIEGAIKLCQRLGKDRHETVELLCEEMGMTKAEAELEYDRGRN